MIPVIVIGLIILVVIAVPVGAVLGVLTIVMAEMSSGGGRLLRAMGDVYWEKGSDFILASVPLFILMGEIILRSGIAARMYNAVAMWISWLPGGLMHANIGACALFAATSGSSVATTATIGTVAYPEIEARGYNERLFLGSLAAGGTLGILIPPSIGLILYGVLTETSVPELYLAGIIPGIALAVLFMAAILIGCLVRRDWGGEPVQTNWALRWRSLRDLIGPVILFMAVIGSIYAGIATPTEAASVGVIFSILLAAFYRNLSIKMLLHSFEATLVTSGMVMLIVLAAIFLNFIIGFMGITQAMLDWIGALGLTPIQTVLMIVVFYLILGMFMETLSMMLTTVPIVYPIIVSLNVPEFTGVWFGIVITLLMEAALITPPIGLNLYVAQGIRTRGGRFADVTIGSLPFLAPMLILILALIFFPGIATWLPDLQYR